MLQVSVCVTWIDMTISIQYSSNFNITTSGLKETYKIHDSGL